MLKSILSKAALALAALTLGGCASFNQLNNEVSTYGAWPDARKPSTYAFERLPSQQGQPQRQQMLEDAARGAVEAAGFVPAADVASAEVVLQLGARITVNDPWYYDDPFWWHGGARWSHRGYYGGYYGRYGSRYYGRGYYGSAWGPYYYDSVYFDREVAVLIRDRKTGEILYEARANSSGLSSNIDYLLPAMFEAALKDFPKTGPNPRTVTVQISKKQ